MMTDASDNDIRELFARDSHAAFRGIVLKYQDRIFNLCLYMLRDRQEAEEAAQDVFVKAYRSFGAFAPHASLYTWLYRIAVNACIDYRRRRRVGTESEEFLADVAASDPTPEEACAAGETRVLVREALAVLPPKIRAVVVLREIEGLSYEETAAAAGISVGTVKSRLARGREALRCSLSRKMRGRG
jgi:RNA polymerase sigma-70 factor, ECF subfamily